MSRRLQGPGASVPRRHRLRHVADRLRRGVPSTLYIDKPMKAHTLMQAIARANRVYPGKDFGLIVDYNGMLKSLREALAQYALGDDGGGRARRSSRRSRSGCRRCSQAIEATESASARASASTRRD